MGPTAYRMKACTRLALLATAALSVSSRLSAQEPPPPPPPSPPAQILPPIAVPVPAPLGPVTAAVRVPLDPGTSADPFWPVFPPPGGPPMAATPPLLVDFWAIGRDRLSGSASDFTMSLFRVGYDFRTTLGPVTLAARPQFEVMFLAGPTPSGPDLPPQTYGLSVALEAEYRFDPKFSVRAMITPGLYTDFNNVNGHAFRIPAEIAGAYELTPQFVLVGGVMYTAQPQWPVLPIAGVIWTPTNDWRLELTFPRLRAIHHFADGLDVYGLFAMQGETYAIRQHGVDDLFQYHEWRLGLGAEWSTPVGFHVFVEAGLSLMRRIDFENQPNYSVDPGLYLRVGGRY